MNSFDKTVGGGINSLLAQNRETIGEPGGMFNFAPKNNPVLMMAEGGVADNQDVTNQPSPFRQIAFSGGFQQESDPAKQYMFNALRNQGISNENLLYSLQQQFGPESSNYWQNLLTPQKQAPAQNVVASTQNVVSPVQNFAPPQTDVLQTLRDAGLKYQPVSVAQDSQFQLPADQPSFETTQPVTQQAVTQQPVTRQAAQKSTTNPNWFKDYIYQGGADDATATQRGIDYVLSEGMRPQDAVNLWNQSLGTNFTAKDFYDATGIDLPKAPNAPPEGQMPNLSFFGREGGWDLAAGAFVDPTRGRVYEPPSGVVFQRGNEVVVGDELFWSPYAPTGDKLRELVQQNQANGYRVGTVVSPYATLVGSQEGKEPPVTIKQLAQEVANSGVDFVAIDPYVGWFDIKSEDLVNWSKQFLDEMRALGKDTILVMQNDVPGANTKEEVFAHNRSLMNIPGFSEYVAYSEMPDEKDRLSGFFDEVYARLDRSEGKKNAGKPPEDRKVALNESTPPTRLAYGGGIGSLAYRMKR